MNALLLVGIQHDFLPGGALAVPGGDEILPVVGELIPEFPLDAVAQGFATEVFINACRGVEHAPATSIA